MPRIRDLSYAQKILRTIDAAEPGMPSFLDENQVLAVLDVGRFLPTEEMTGQAGAVVDQPGGISAGELWAHGGNRTSGAGGAGQFSGILDTYQGIGAAEAVTKLQIVQLRVRPTVDARLRFFYSTVDVFGGESDLGNLENNARSASDPTASNFGFIDSLAQTSTPDTTNTANHSAMTVRVIMDLPANSEFVFDLGPVALFSRVVGAQTQAMGWGIWAAAAVTAITAVYSVIVRKLPA